MVTPKKLNRTFKPMRAEVATQWHPTKNGDLKAETTPAASNKKVWWMCEKQHEWEATPNNRQTRGCPYCGNRKILAGYNDLATIHPQIAAQWHPTKNGNLTPQQVPPSSAKKVWWICDNGHEWENTVNRRSEEAKKGHKGCAVCSNQKVLPDFNDLATTHPELAKLWHPTKNNLTPTQVSYGANVKIWWTDSCKHEWTEKVTQQSKVNKAGRVACKICRGAEILTGFNDLATTHPEVAAEWHPTKNGNLKPQDITKGMRVDAWWLGECGHEWKAVVYSRTNSGRRSCPICANQKVLKGFNDADSLIPGLSKYWHPTKNGELKLEQFTPGSNKLFWWQCDKGHEFYMKLAEKTARQPEWCPTCFFENPTYSSVGEKEIVAFIENLGYTTLIRDRKILKGQELDIYIPEKKIAIEFNGLYWHSEQRGKGKWYHHAKWLACQEQGIQLIQIWEDDWNFRKPIVKRTLKNKIGISNDVKIGARKTKIATITPGEAQRFMEENHIQGHAAGSYYIGLKTSDDKIVAVLTLKKTSKTDNKILNIVRYATSQNVQGGFTKLINHATKTYNPESFVTFSDNSISNGSLYANSGFEVAGELPPDYSYYVGRQRQHKFGYRKSRFKKDPTLEFEDNLSENELADLNNIPRIWDSGKIKWSKKV